MRHHRGKNVGTVQAGWAIGWGLATLCYALRFLAVGGNRLASDVLDRAPAVLVFYNRRKVGKPEMYTKTRQTIIAGHTGSFLEIFRPNFFASRH